VILDGDFGDLSLPHLLDEGRIVDLRLHGLTRVELVEHRHQHQRNNQPDTDILEKIIQFDSFTAQLPQ
jgi:hypothetical protein